MKGMGHIVVDAQEIGQCLVCGVFVTILDLFVCGSNDGVFRVWRRETAPLSTPFTLWVGDTCRGRFGRDAEAGLGDGLTLVFLRKVEIWSMSIVLDWLSMTMLLGTTRVLALFVVKWS